VAATGIKAQDREESHPMTLFAPFTLRCSSAPGCGRSLRGISREPVASRSGA
jgi:hypothetical protein